MRTTLGFTEPAPVDVDFRTDRIAGFGATHFHQLLERIVIVSKGVRVGTDFGEGEVVAVTKEWVVVNIGGKTSGQTVGDQTAKMWLVAAGYAPGNGGCHWFKNHKAAKATFPVSE